MRGLQAMRGVGGAELARLDDEGAERRHQQQKRKGTPIPGAGSRKHVESTRALDRRDSGRAGLQASVQVV